MNPTDTALHELVAVMAALRGENGCPWDKKQTHDTLRKYLIEEAYEVIDAIENKNMAALCEELGDVLLQIVFHAQLATEAGSFTIHDVIRSITEKMIRRHPHVFGEEKAADADDVLDIWQAVKAKENAALPRTEARESLMDGIPRHLPALMYAAEVGKRAARVGFDWSTATEVLAKVEEERREFEEALERLSDTSSSAEGEARVREEWGDWVFSLVNLARHLKIDPEGALREAASKFESRFRSLEQAAARQGADLQGLTLTEMDALWDQVKGERERNEP